MTAIQKLLVVGGNGFLGMFNRNIALSKISISFQDLLYAKRP
jgi:hypothetical protein